MATDHVTYSCLRHREPVDWDVSPYDALAPRECPACYPEKANGTLADTARIQETLAMRGARAIVDVPVDEFQPDG